MPTIANGSLDTLKRFNKRKGHYQGCLDGSIPTSEDFLNHLLDLYEWNNELGGKKIEASAE